MSIKNHAGSKYIRRIFSAVDKGSSVEIDVYAVLEAFQVTCPARQHAIKKLLCAGIRGKGSQMQDLDEAINSCGPRILELQAIREREAQGVAGVIDRHFLEVGEKPQNAEITFNNKSYEDWVAGRDKSRQNAF